MAEGHVVGGDFLKAPVRKATFGSDLVVHTGLKGRRLNSEQVVKWVEESSESNRGVVSKVGRAVAKAVLPMHLRAAGSEAVGATVEATFKPWHTVRVYWADGKQSLLKLPDEQYIHFELVLENQREGELVIESSSSEIDVIADAPPTITDRAFAIASNLVGKIPGKAVPADVSEQLRSLASLRDAGILTDDEFNSKKADLLARL